MTFDTLVNRIIAGSLLVAVEGGCVRVVWYGAAPFAAAEVAAWGTHRPGVLLAADDPRNYAFLAALRRAQEPRK